MQPAKVLVVDDSALMHKLLRALLPTTAVIDAGDGLEALSRLAENPDVELMILDVNMPRMNGLELLAKLKADTMLAGIPVVVMSTEGKEHDLVRGLRAGAAAYIRKPFQHQEILDLIARL
jgi:CheY-like chemotaxis protein